MSAPVISKDKYSPEKIDRLKLLLQREYDEGNPLHFEIKVDDMIVVPKTSNPASFDKFHDHLDEDTTKVAIIIYRGKSNYSDKYFFAINAHSREEAVALLGIDEDGALAKPRKNDLADALAIELENVKRQKDEAEAKLQEAEDSIEDLMDQIEVFQSKKFHLGNINLGELSSMVVEGMIRRNTHLIAKIPGAEGLAGLIENDNKTKTEAAPQENVNVSFSKDEPTGVDSLPPDVKMFVEFMQDFRDTLSQSQMDDLIVILNHLRDHTEKIKTIKSLL